ncbi:MULTISPECIES: F0F1 ATP synthase subunit A [Candidatus Ichthyocystis]|uniref:F0F1 ATP synthase subunit A n=1 Tax=Candidatus Ichthyocystis TaxID=2929841 RepID=UPI000B856B98
MAAPVDASSLTPAGYVLHHLRSMVSKDFGHHIPIVDFSYINIDTVLWSVLMSVFAFLFMFLVARRATAGVPSRWQCSVEILFEFFASQVRSIIPGSSKCDFVIPLSVSVFIWIFMMNALDLLPVDLFPRLFSVTGISEYQRIVPTADVNGALGMSLGVLLLMFFYGIKSKKLGFFKELVTAPFGSKLILFIPNLVINVIEYSAKFVSLGLRLFGNMYAGELLFMLIALMGATAKIYGCVGQFFAGLLWAIAHIFIISLQAFIFVMLMMIYIGQAQEKH